MKTKAIKILSLLLCVCTIALIGKSNSSFPSSAELSAENVIILDAGHGGFDGGAVAEDGTIEKNINLKICISIAELLKTSGYEVVLTRESDISTEDNDSEKIPSRKKSDLRNRLNLMKNYPNSVFISIHLNKFTTSAARGAQIFYSEREKESKILAEDIRKSITDMLQPDNTRVNKKSTSSTYILHNATVPAVLVECGFLSNPEELQMLKDHEYQKKMAFCIFCGIQEYFSKGII